MKVLIAKLGYVTRLYSACNDDMKMSLGNFNDNAECYTFRTLLAERTGDDHGSIKIVAGRHMIEESRDKKFVIWYVTGDEAEPYSTYRTLAEAMDQLKEMEEITFA